MYGGPGERTWTDIPDAHVQDPRDAVIRVDAVTICGTDLHILGGDVPEVTPGRVLGHEAVGTISELGGGVSGLAEGDRVLASCISACGVCRYCRTGSRTTRRLHLEDLWIRNVTITTGLVDTYSTPKLLDMLVAGQLDTGHMVTHRFALDQIMEAYDVFSLPAETGALKVVLSR
ncbi:MAG: alcohol dehydrogenase [Actinoplanes sp.]|nr:alcohol dehydrogenase [Actinoplanes sp.]